MIQVLKFPTFQIDMSIDSNFEYKFKLFETVQTEYVTSCNRICNRSRLHLLIGVD